MKSYPRWLHPRRSLHKQTAMLAACLVLAGCAGEPDRVPPTAMIDSMLARAGSPVGLVPKQRVPAGEDDASAADRRPVRFLGRETAATGAAAGGALPGQEPMVTLNFVQAEVTEVVRSILGELLHEPFSVVSEVEGSITIQSTGPIPESSALGVLEEALRINGGALVRTDDVYTILPLAQAAGRAPVRAPGQGPVPGFRTTVLPVNHVGADNIAEVIRPVLGESRFLSVGPLGRTLVFAGTEQEAETVAELVRTFDQDWLSSMNFSVYPLRNARPSAVVADLDPVFGDGGSAAGGEGGEEGPPVRGRAGFRLVPVDRMDAVVIISPSTSALYKAERWLELMDTTARGETPRLYVYKPQNGEAEALADALNALFETGGGGRAAPEDVLPPGAEGTLLGSAVETGQPRADEAPSASPATADGAAATGPRVYADTDQNALLIRATPREYDRLLEALEQLDTAPRQVLVEATIAEVRLTDELRYGLQWFFRSGNVTAALSSGGSALPQTIFPGFSFLFDTTDARVVLDALDSMTDVNVVSSPQVLVLDNQAARLQVGDQVPVATQTVQSIVDPEAPIANTIQYRDTGVILEVKPRVTSEALVVLEIRQEVSDVAVTQTSGIDSPTIQQRTLESTVAVRSGQTIALGGLIRDRMERGRDGLPVLSQLPVAGALFGSRTSRDDRTELLILLTPRVVETARESEQITRELRERMGRMRSYRMFEMPNSPREP